MCSSDLLLIPIIVSCGIGQMVETLVLQIAVGDLGTGQPCTERGLSALVCVFCRPGLAAKEHPNPRRGQIKRLRHLLEPRPLCLNLFRCHVHGANLPLGCDIRKYSGW